MTARTPPPEQRWLPWAGLAVFVLGVVWNSSAVSSHVDRNTDRIGKLEASDAAQADKLETINMRGERIEAKIDILLPRAKDEQP